MSVDVDIKTRGPKSSVMAGSNGHIDFAVTAPSARHCDVDSPPRYHVHSTDLQTVVAAIQIDDEVVQPQPGGFYGGWVTSEIVGPYKGQPGTSGW